MKHLSIEHRRHIAEARKGKHYPNLSKAKKGIWTGGGFKKGHVPWNAGLKGIHLSPETEFKKGCKSYKRTFEHRLKMSNSIPKGKDHYRWKGGFKNRSKHYDSIRLRIWREKVFKRDCYTCQKCGKKGGRLQAHHKKSWSLYPLLRYIVRNGITLCLQCHRNVHKKEL